jgi:hypothetical protein
MIMKSCTPDSGAQLFMIMEAAVQVHGERREHGAGGRPPRARGAASAMRHWDQPSAGLDRRYAILGANIGSNEAEDSGLMGGVKGDGAAGAMPWR